MSLKVWLPLIDNLNNQGTDTINIQNNGATVNSSGKLGSCYSFNGSSNYLFSEYNFYNLNYSVSAWIYTTSASATQTIVCDRTAVGYGFSTFLIGGKLRIDAGGNNLQWTTSYSYPANTWFHLAVTYDGTNVSYYINGVFKEKKAQALNSSYWGNITSIGASQANGSGYGNYLNGRLNDIRIYDHCLSDKEVKEISQGLVLHYKLDGWSGGIGDNLILNTKLLSISSSRYVKYCSKRGDSTRQLRPDGFYEVNCTASWQGLSTWANSQELIVGQKYTYSFYFYTDGSTKNLSFYPMMYNSGGTRDTSSTLPISVDGSAYVNGNAKSFGSFSNTTPVRHYVTFEWNSTMASIISNGGTIELSIQVHGTFNSGEYGCLYAPKLEIGPINTAWSPAPSELEIDTYKIVDSSGYSRNGLVSGTAITQGDSDKRYNFSSKFTGAQLIEAPWNPAGTNSFTISGWFYNSGGTTYYAAKNTYNTYVCLEQSRYFVYSYSGSAYVGNYTSTPNVWQHIVLVHDDVSKKLKLYIDGSFISEVTTNGTLYDSDILDIGGRQDSAQYIGKMADFRIYATALSAADILDLYHTSTNIDNLGDIHSFEFNEVETTNLSDFSLTSSNWVSDGVTATYTTEHNIGDIVKMVPSSGNKRIYHNVSNVWTSGKVYLVSLWARADSSGAVIRPSRSIADFATPNFNLTTEWKQYYGIINCTTTATGGTLSISYSGSTNIPCYISHIKLEEANKNLVSILKTGVFKENWLDEENFTSNAKILKGESVTIGREFIEK